MTLLSPWATRRPVLWALLQNTLRFKCTVCSARSYTHPCSWREHIPLPICVALPRTYSWTGHTGKNLTYLHGIITVFWGTCAGLACHEPFQVQRAPDFFFHSPVCSGAEPDRKPPCGVSERTWAGSYHRSDMTNKKSQVGKTLTLLDEGGRKHSTSV